MNFVTTLSVHKLEILFPQPQHPLKYQTFKKEKTFKIKSLNLVLTSLCEIADAAPLTPRSKKQLLYTK